MTRTLELPRWEIPDRVVLEGGVGGLPRLFITTPLASAHVYLHGAHVTHYQPVGAAPILFLSRSSLFAPEKAIRGGVPIIFPWFGPRDGQTGSPMHGVARTAEWEIEEIDCGEDEIVRLSLRLAPNDVIRARWPHMFLLRHRITIGAQLRMALEVENICPAPFAFEEALHTYLAVSDVREVAVSGLGETEFIDKTDDLQRKRQREETLRITGETDRVYLNTQSACSLHDPALRRRITIEKSGSDTTVVWNPWIAKAAGMADFGDDEWTRMLCIETANTGGNTVTLSPGATHVMEAVIAVTRE
jgi:glucose-6-phosphate 1-epimerase